MLKKLKNRAVVALIVASCLLVTLYASLSSNPSKAAAAPAVKASVLVYAAEDGLYSAGLSGVKPVLLVKGKNISSPVFSSDGNAVAYLQNGDLYFYDLATSKTGLMLKQADCFCSGQKDQFYASSQATGIVAADYRKGKSTTLIEAQKDTTYHHLALSPDQKILAYDVTVSGIENFKKCGTWIYDTSTQKSRVIVQAYQQDENDLGVRPSAGKWFPDSRKLVVWLMSQSGSLSADGVGVGIFDLKSGKLKELDTGSLAYNENISFGSGQAVALITGGGREMFAGKKLELFDSETGKRIKTIPTPGVVPTTPCFSPDGKLLAYSASPVVKANDEYKNQLKALSKRQLYLYKDNKASALTSSTSYRSELPIFLKDAKHILFARISTTGEKSLWVMDSSGSNQKQVAKWTYSDAEDSRSTDFYGRIDWSNMFALFE